MSYVHSKILSHNTLHKMCHAEERRVFMNRELSETRKELAATKCFNTELEGKLGSAERQISILEVRYISQRS